MREDPRSVRVGLVGCVKSKRVHACPARDLYISPLFVGRRRHVERTCDAWFVLSARHGLVHPDDRLETYDVTLNAMNRSARRAWSTQVLRALAHRLGGLADHHFEIHAGAAYSDFGLVEGLSAAGAYVTMPAAGLGLGEQLAYYRDAGSHHTGERSV